MIRAIILFALLYFLFRLLFSPKGKVFPQGGNKKKVSPRHQDAHDMVPCANCGVFIATKEAREQGGRYFCQPRCGC